MEVLFRFNILREANKSSDEIDSIDLSANTEFQRSASAIPNGPDRKRRLRELSLALYLLGSLYRRRRILRADQRA